MQVKVSDAEPPGWALKLVSKISRDHSFDPPYLSWTKRRGEDSSGYCELNGRIIGVRAGSSDKDTRYTILHEMAHLILLRTAKDYAGDHGEMFYSFLWHIVKKYRFSIKHALTYESGQHRLMVQMTYRKSGGRLKV